MFQSRTVRFSAVIVVLLSLAAGAQSQSALPAPTGLEASDGSYSTTTGLSWDHVRGAESYRIFRHPTNDPLAATEIGSTASIIFYDRRGEAGKTFFYWVKASGHAAESDFSIPDEGRRAIGKLSAFGPIGPLQPPPVPLDNPVTGAKVYLGKTLFWDEQLSSTRTVACGTCHIFSRGSTDPRVRVGAPHSTNPGVDDVFGTADDIFGSPGVPRSDSQGNYDWSTSFGFNPQVTRRKAQSVVDAAYSDIGLFWDGRAERTFLDPETSEIVFKNAAPLESQALESQALDPFLSTTEMAHEGRTLADVVARIIESQPLALAPSIPPALQAWISGRTYRRLFAEAFGSPDVTPVRIAMAIASYERTLYSDRAGIDTTDSGIGEPSPEAQRGRQLFFANFCNECHRTSVVGDNRFRFVGIRPDSEDLDRAEVTKKGTDRGRFRTPSLRNVDARAPFMHSGSLATLEDVIEFYDRGGDFDSPNKDRNFVRPMRLETREKSNLLAFLRTLSDPRVLGEQGPLFDRPMLYSESARVPMVFGAGTTPGTFVPRIHAIEPPVIGNPNFTVAISNARGGAEAILVIDDSDPGSGTTIPDTASLARVSTRLSGTQPGEGTGSVSIAISDDPELVGKTFVGRWYVRSGVLVWSSPAFQITVFGPITPGASVGAFSSVSAASLATGLVAPESIVSGFGANLAFGLGTARSLPLPVTLRGIDVAVTDASGASRAAPLFFVSSAQVNYLVPTGTGPGEAGVEVRLASQVISRGTIQVAAVAPGIFSANSNGSGVAAALALRVRPDGSQVVEQVAQFDSIEQRFVANPIELGPDGDQVILLLFGTGLRLAESLTATVGGEPAEVLFSGAQPEFAGVDQVNLRLPSSLAGRGEVEIVLTSDKLTSNRVTINVR